MGGWMDPVCVVELFAVLVYNHWKTLLQTEVSNMEYKRKKKKKKPAVIVVPICTTGGLIEDEWETMCFLCSAKFNGWFFILPFWSICVTFGVSGGK